MKKIISITKIIMLFVLTFVTLSPAVVSAHGVSEEGTVVDLHDVVDDDIVHRFSENSYIKKLSNDNGLVSYLAVEENGDSNIIKINEYTHEVSIDGKLLTPEYVVADNQGSSFESQDSLITPYAIPTIDFRSAGRHNLKIPFGGVAVFTTALIGIVPGIGWGVAGAAASAVASYVPSWVYVTFTQYKSIETYVSSYSGSRYKKGTNRNINIYKNSVSYANLVYGPVQGGWFDPIRP